MDHHFTCFSNSLQELLLTTLLHKNRAQKVGWNFILTSLAINYIILYTLLYLLWILLPYSYGNKISSGTNRQWFSIIGRIIQRLLRFLWRLYSLGYVWRLDYTQHKVFICMTVFLMTSSEMVFMALIGLQRTKVYVTGSWHLTFHKSCWPLVFSLLVCQN